MPAQLTCPKCSKVIEFKITVLPRSATCDCSHCGTLLLLEDGKLTDFNKTMHERDARWPADGKNTGWIEIPGDD